MDEIKRSENQSGRAVNAVMLVAIMTFLTKILGFVREMALAARFGAGYETDAYKIALMVPAILYASIEAILATTFIPLFINTEEKDRSRFVNNLITVVVLFASILALAGMILSPLLIRLVAPGFEKQTAELAASLMRIIFPMIIFMGIASLAAAYLQSHNHFLAPSMMAIPNNLIIIGTLIFLGSSGVYGLAVATVLGVLSQFIFQYPFLLKFRLRYKPILDFKDPGLIRLVHLAVPVLLGTMVGQVNSLADKYFGSSLAVGNISALDYANKINGMVLAVFTSSIVIVSYPQLSRLSAEGKHRDFVAFFRKSLQSVFFITAPIMVALMVLNVPVIRLLFERGAFDKGASQLTAIALLFYSIGIPAAGMREILNKTFYSLQDTRTPMFNGVIAVLINITLNAILIRYLAIGGIALATSLSAVISTSMLLYRLRNRIGNYVKKDFVFSFLRTGLASLVMGAVLWSLEYRLLGARLSVGQLGILAKLFIEGLCGVGAFVLTAWLLRSQELQEGMGMLKGWMRRRRGGITG